MSFSIKKSKKSIIKSETSRRYVDELIKVFLQDGREQWILIHVEIQSQRSSLFPERMFEYFYKLIDLHRRPVASVAILADEHPQWHPSTYEYEMLGTKLRFEYQSIKLLDFASRVEELEQDDNPFALIVLAHLKALFTRGDMHLRLSEKLSLIRTLLNRGYNIEQAGTLFALLDMLVTLPRSLERQADEQLQEWSKMQEIQLISGYERRAEERWRKKRMEEERREGRQEGRQEGRREGEILAARKALREVVRARFGRVPRPVEAHIKRVSDLNMLQRLLRSAVTLNTLTEFTSEISQLVP